MTEYPNFDLRASVTERIRTLADAVRKLDGATTLNGDAARLIDVTWTGFAGDYYGERSDGAKSLVKLAKLVRADMMRDLYAFCEQLATLLVRDVIAVIARTSDEPVAWLTGNAYMPPLRDLGEAETVYQADMDGTVWEAFMEALDRKLSEANILMECPEYDNALYVVDLNRFEHVERDDSCESLNDEWQRIAVNN
jgi:hypothetical protein